MTYLPDRILAGETSADPLDEEFPSGSKDSPRDVPRVGGDARSLPPRRRPRLPVGPPLDHRARACSASRTSSRGVRPARPTTQRSWTFDLDPDGARPGARHRAAPGGLLRPRARLPARHHRAGGRRRRVRPGRHQRLPADHPRPLLRVARAPPRRRPGPVARRPPRGDGVGHEAGLHRGQQRRLPLRLRRLAGGLRGRLRPALDRDGLARGAARATAAT